MTGFLIPGLALAALLFRGRRDAAALPRPQRDTYAPDLSALDELEDIPSLRDLRDGGLSATDARKTRDRAKRRQRAKRRARDAAAPDTAPESAPAAAPSGDELSDARAAAEAAEAAARASEIAPAEEPSAPPKKKPRARPRKTPGQTPSDAVPSFPGGDEVVAPEAPTPAALPDGYNPEVARREAPKVAAHIINAGGGSTLYRTNIREWAEAARRNYARRLIESWQRYAGLKPDKIYGPRTRSALKYYGAANAPIPLFRRRSDGTLIQDTDPDAAYIPPEER